MKRYTFVTDSVLLPLSLNVAVRVNVVPVLTAPAGEYAMDAVGA